MLWALSVLCDPFTSTNRTRKEPREQLRPALFKTVREIALEQKIADLERALMRA